MTPDVLAFVVLVVALIALNVGAMTYGVDSRAKERMNPRLQPRRDI